MKYQKVTSYEAKKGGAKKVLLLYSGGLDSSICLKWIQDEFNCEVVTFTADLGQFQNKPHNEKEKIKQKALKLGATDAVIIDLTDEFTNEYISKSILANGSYRGKYYLSTPLGRPLVAKTAAELAKKYNCDTVAHGCTGKGNDQVRLDAGIIASNPSLKIIAPVREWNMNRSDEMKYAMENGIEVVSTKDSPYSHDENIWGNTSEGAEIEFPHKSPNFSNALKWCVTPDMAPNNPASLLISFQEGLPVALNHCQLPLTEIISKLNHLGAEHGIGVATIIEDRILGMKSRGVYESPAAEIIISAHKELEKLVLTREQLDFKSIVDQKWSSLCYHSSWFDPIMNDLNAYLKTVNKCVSGEVKVSLYKGNCSAYEVSSPNSLFNIEAASFDEAGQSFNTNASAPFIEHLSAWQWASSKLNKEGVNDVQTLAK